MIKRILLALTLSLGLGRYCLPQASPYNLTSYTAQTFTASATTGAAIPLGNNQYSATTGASFGAGVVSVNGTGLTTVTFALQGSNDGGTTYFPLYLTSGADPTVGGATITATTNGIYTVNLAGLTHVRFVTSGTFTASSVALRLTASPNASARSGGPSGSGPGAGVSSFNSRTGAVSPQTNDYNFNQLEGTAATGQIPALDAGKITTGVFAPQRFCSGTFPTAGYYCDPNTGSYTAIPTTFNASAITSGVFDPARIPSKIPASFYNLAGVGLSWDSFGAGSGNYDPAYQGFLALLAKDIPAPITNTAISGTLFANGTGNNANIFSRFYLNWEPDAIWQDFWMLGGGENDQVPCASATGTCGLSLQYMFQAYLVYHGIPFGTNTQMASASSGTSGSFTADTALLKTFALVGSPGTPMFATVNGAAKTWTIPANATSIDIGYKVIPTAGGSATFSADGVLLTDGCSNTTTFTYQACSPTTPVIGAAGAIYDQHYTLGAGTGSGGTHPVVMTLNSTGTFEPAWVKYTTPSMPMANPTAIINMATAAITSPLNTNAVVFNQVSANAAATYSSFNLPFWVIDVVNGTPGMNTSADFQTGTSPGLSPTGVPWAPSNLGAHPGPLGNYDLEQTVLNSLAAHGINASSFGYGGKTVDRTGIMREVARYVPANGLSQQPLRKGLFDLGAGGPTQTTPGFIDSDITSDQSGWIANYRFAADTTKVFGNRFFHGAWQKGGNYNFCPVATTAQTLDTLQASVVWTLPTGEGCIDANANATFNFVTQVLGASIASQATMPVTAPISHVTGTAAISLITPTATVCTTNTKVCTINLWPDAAWTLATGGTSTATSFAFVNNSTAVPGRMLTVWCDPVLRTCATSY